MNVREKLVELLRDVQYLGGLEEKIADHLIANSVTVQEWISVDAIEVIHCHECIGKSTWINDPKYGCAVCTMSGMYPKNENGYCSYAIRKGDKK